MKQHWQDEQRVMLVKCRAFIEITTKNTFKLCKMLLIKLIGMFVRVLPSGFLDLEFLQLIILSILKFMFLMQCTTDKGIPNCCCFIWGFEGCQSDRGCWSCWGGEIYIFRTFSFFVNLTWYRSSFTLSSFEYIYNCLCSYCRFWKLTLRLKKSNRYIFLTIFFLLILIVKIRQSWAIPRFQPFQFRKSMIYFLRL